MKVLVTGGAGFVGTNLIKRLLKDGHSVVSIDNYSNGKRENEQDGCIYYNMDIRHLTPADYSMFGDVGIVYHLAGLARIQISFENPKSYFESNSYGTYNIVDYCTSANIPLVYAGTSSKHSGKFKNPYTFTKDIGEDIIKLHQLHFNLKASITRFYNVYGLHQVENANGTLIGRWLYNLKNGKDCIIYGDGCKRRDFTHVDDIVDALIRIPQKNAWGYEFELGNGKNHSVNEVAEMFGIEPIYEDNKPGEAQSTLNTDTLATTILDWNPKVNLNDYIKELKL